jgi:hypothetical protein
VPTHSDDICIYNPRSCDILRGMGSVRGYMSQVMLYIAIGLFILYLIGKFLCKFIELWVDNEMRLKKDWDDL